MIPSVPFKRHFLLGHTKPFAADTRGFVLACAAANMPMASARIAFRDFVILLDEEAILHVLQKHHRNYAKSFAYKGLKEFLGQGLLTAEGDRWLANRRALQPGFHRPIVAQMQHQLESVVQQKLDILPLNTPTELQPLFLEWTRDLLLQAFFGLAPGEVAGMDSMHEHLWFLRTYANNRMKNPFMAPPSWPTATNRQFKTAVQELEAIILNVFEQSAGKPEHGALVQHMLEQKKEGAWTDQQVFDEIITLFLAGQETTTNAMILLVHSMLQHPQVLENVRNPEHALQWEHVINEVLRLYPPAWAVSREALADDVVLKEQIQQGSTLFLSIYAMHRHPHLWDQPDEFMPERFLGDYPRKAFLPFGIGPRMCIGNHFAMLEMEVMARMLFDAVRVVDRNKEALELVTPITMGPKNAYVVAFE